MFYNKIYLVIYILLSRLSCQCFSAKILVHIPSPFYSHQATFRPLWKELAKRGHTITLLTVNPMEHNENITQIDLSVIYQKMEEINYFKVVSSGEQSFQNLKFGITTVMKMMEVQLDQPEVKKLIQSNEKFDLVITEFYATIGAAFAQKFNCPFIGVVSMDAHQNGHSIIGNPTHPILYPLKDLGFYGKLSFKQRIVSSLYYFLSKLYWNLLSYHQNKVIQKHFGKMPTLSEISKNISLLFTNLNPIFHTVRPLNFQTINIGGGLQMEKPKPLPKELQDYLDLSTQGVIYFSLGSSIRSTLISQKMKSIILKTFSELPYQVLWKFENVESNLVKVPRNVNISRWYPQQDVLRHPNVKLFISHGGLQSLEEALFCGVPVLALPFFGDQILNSNKMVLHGFGLSLEHKNLEDNELNKTIIELINNPKYKEKALLLANQILDQPMTSLEKAVWWTEYVLRHKNVDILKHPYGDIPFYQYYFIDLIVFAIFLLGLAVYLVKFTKKVSLIFYNFKTKRKVKTE